MRENQYQAGLKKRLKSMFPGCLVTKLDSSDIQGIPDLLILYKNKWAILEVKKDAEAPHRPNQDYYVAKLNFIKHSNLSGHAPFSPSHPAWLRYDADKAIKYLIAKKASERGTRLHAWAKETIDMKIKQPRSKKTLYSYVNDAIGFRMDTEVVLYYSPNFWGTADSICFRDNVLRIHDLKTGTGPIHEEQVLVYAALFCLEYKIRPGDIEMELRIYQNDDIDVLKPTASDIVPIMDRIIHLDKLINQAVEEG